MAELVAEVEALYEAVYRDWPTWCACGNYSTGDCSRCGKPECDRCKHWCGLTVDGIVYTRPAAACSRRPMVELLDDQAGCGVWVYMSDRLYCDWCWVRHGSAMHYDYLHPPRRPT